MCRIVRALPLLKPRELGFARTLQFFQHSTAGGAKRRRNFPALRCQRRRTVLYRATAYSRITF